MVHVSLKHLQCFFDGDELCVLWINAGIIDFRSFGNFNLIGIQQSLNDALDGTSLFSVLEDFTFDEVNLTLSKIFELQFHQILHNRNLKVTLEITVNNVVESLLESCHFCRIALNFVKDLLLAVRCDFVCS